MNLGLEGKVVIVTGGAAGIGLASVRMLAGEGAKVVMADLSEDRVAGEAAALREQGYEVLPVVVDVSDEASVDQMVAAARASYGTIDILVNNAG